MPPGIDGERLADDPLAVMKSCAHRGRRRIKTNHKHADKPSRRAAPLSQAAGQTAGRERIYCRAASAARANASAAADS